MAHGSLLFSALILLLMLASPARAQAPQQEPAGPKHEREEEIQTPPGSLSEQLSSLQHQVSKLEARVKEQGVDTAAMKTNGDERRMKMAMGGVPQSASQQPMNSANTPMQGMNMMSGMMSMMSSMMGGMGGMPGGSPMSPPLSIGGQAVLSSLPGFPGASHLYHIGSTNFFLDHPEHITLSLEQQRRLSELRTKALTRRSEFNRRIQAGEEQLWLLTASDQPNLVLVESKIREIEKLRGDLRVAFIKDVGEAALILTGAQRMALLGQAPGNSATALRNSVNTNAMGDM